MSVFQNNYTAHQREHTYIFTMKHGVGFVSSAGTEKLVEDDEMGNSDSNPG